MTEQETLNLFAKITKAVEMEHDSQKDMFLAQQMTAELLSRMIVRVEAIERKLMLGTPEGQGE